MENNVPGKSAAVASLVLGIVSLVFWFFGYSALFFWFYGFGYLISIVCGIVGLICASSSKKAGYEGGIRKGGFVCSLIGLIGGAIVFLACVACVGIASSALSSLGLSLSDLAEM